MVNADPYSYPVVIGAIIFLAALIDRLRQAVARGSGGRPQAGGLRQRAPGSSCLLTAKNDPGSLTPDRSVRATSCARTPAISSLDKFRARVRTGASSPDKGG